MTLTMTSLEWLKWKLQASIAIWTPKVEFIDWLSNMDDYFGWYNKSSDLLVIRL